MLKRAEQTKGERNENKFHGYSDDTFGEYGETGQDVDNCGSLEPVQCVVDCGAQGRLMVIGQYSKASLNNGCWMVGVSKVGEYDDFPDWKIMTGYCAEAEYSSELVIEIPDGFFDLEWYRNGERVED